MSRPRDATRERAARRQTLRELADVAIAAADPRAAVRAYLTAASSRWPSGAPAFVIALGKAAPAMVAGALDAQVAAVGLLVTTSGSEVAPEIFETFEVIRGEHPIPGPGSFHAGARLVDVVESLSPEARVLCLLSGGASALCELPIDGVSHADLQAMTQALLASGLPIDVLNAARSCVSLLKGGRLRALLGDRTVETLVVSDVPTDDPTVIASGPMDPAGDLARTRIATLKAHPVFPSLPVSVREAASVFQPLTQRGLASAVILSGRIVAERVAEAARARDLSVATEGPLEGEARVQGSALANRELHVDCTIVHGETTVTLPLGVETGRGGRNQELALSFATSLPERDSRMLLALATDGVDGPSGAAGAIVDADTCAEGKAAGFDVASALAGHDTGTFLEAAGALLHVPPTGTNVADLVVILR